MTFHFESPYLNFIYQASIQTTVGHPIVNRYMIAQNCVFKQLYIITILVLLFTMAQKVVNLSPMDKYYHLRHNFYRLGHYKAMILTTLFYKNTLTARREH